MKYFLILFMLAVFSCLAQAQVGKSLTLSAGTLSTILTLTEKQKVTNLTIRGTIDARDFKTMRDEMLALSSLNLESATIVAYSGTQGPSGLKSNVYPANTFPANAFNRWLQKSRAILTTCTLPSSVTAIGANGFKGCFGLGTVTLPGGLLSIGEGVFSGCNALTGIHSLPSSLQTIGSSAFESCYSLEGSLTIPGSVTSIGKEAFGNCKGLESITIHSNLAILTEKLFQLCIALIEVNLPETITVFGDSLFYKCSNLQTLNFPDSLHTIGSGAFLDCGLVSVLLPPGLESIGAEAFRNTDILYFQIPSRVSFIGANAFRGTIAVFTVGSENEYFSSSGGGLLNKDQTLLIRGSKDNFLLGGLACSYSIPESVETIGEYAFEDFSWMNRISIPSGISGIGFRAFYNCIPTYLRIDCMNPAGIVCDESFSTTSIMLDVPYGTKELYEAIEPWKNFPIFEGRIMELSTHQVNVSDTATIAYGVQVDANNFWISVADQPWVNITPAEAVFGDSTILITVDQNVGEVRTANIIVISSYKTDTIYVRQNKMHAPVFSSNEVVLGAKDNLTSVIEVTSIYQWIASDDQPWLSLSPGLPTQGNGQLILSAEPNNGPERTATVTVIAQGSIQIIEVTQQAGDGSLIDMPEENTSVLYPNPVSKGFLIRGEGDTGMLSIIDRAGKVVFRDHYICNQIVDVSFLPAGMFMVRFVQEDTVRNYKLVKK